MHQHTEVTDVYLNELLKVNDKEDKTEQYWFRHRNNLETPQHTHLFRNEYLTNWWNFKH